MTLIVDLAYWWLLIGAVVICVLLAVTTFVWVRERWWDHDRRERVAVHLEADRQERERVREACEWMGAFGRTLDEIHGLPERPRRTA